MIGNDDKVPIKLVTQWENNCYKSLYIKSTRTKIMEVALLPLLQTGIFLLAKYCMSERRSKFNEKILDYFRGSCANELLTLTKSFPSWISSVSKFLFKINDKDIRTSIRISHCLFS